MDRISVRLCILRVLRFLCLRRELLLNGLKKRRLMRLQRTAIHYLVESLEF
ncbi:hypothetical protein M8C21_024300, partial [Ambrosia artemisiifolia]